MDLVNSTLKFYFKIDFMVRKTLMMTHETFQIQLLITNIGFITPRMCFPSWIHSNEEENY